MKLASIPKYKLNIHDDRVNELSQKKVVSLTFEQSTALKTILRELESVENSIVQEGESDQLDITEQVIAR